MDERELLKLKDQINEAKTKVAELNGRRGLIAQRLLEEWKCRDTAAAEKKLESIEQEISELKEKLAAGTKKVEEWLNQHR